MLTLSTLSLALALSAATPASGPLSLDAVLGTAGGPDVQVTVVKVHNQPSANCQPQRVIRPQQIRVSGPTPFILQGRDAQGRVCQTLVRATIQAQAMIQTLKRDVAVGEKVSPRDFQQRWVSVEQAHGKLRHPIAGAAQTRVRKGHPIGITSFTSLNPSAVRVNLITGALTIRTSGKRKPCRGDVTSDVACVRLENGQKVQGRVGPNGVVTVVLP